MWDYELNGLYIRIINGEVEIFRERGRLRPSEAELTAIINLMLSEGVSEATIIACLCAQFRYSRQRLEYLVRRCRASLPLADHGFRL